MLAELFDRIIKATADAATPKPTTVPINGEVYLRQPHGSYELQTPVDRGAHLRQVQVVDLDSLLAWAGGCEDAGLTTGELHISRDGTSHALSPRLTSCDVAQDQARKAWFGEYLPSPHAMGYADFRGWIDGLGEGLLEREGIEAELAVMSGTIGRAKTIRMTGAVMQVLGESKKEVLGGLRRRITANIPYGDPSFRTDVEFLLTCTVNERDSSLLFQVERMATDVATDAYLAWASAIAMDKLPKGWLLLLTP